MRLIVDSGATDHMINDLSLFNGGSYDLDSPVVIATAKNGPSLKAEKAGTIVTEQCILKDVLYAPELSVNLLSVQKVVQSGVEVKFHSQGVQITKDSKKELTSESPFYIDLDMDIETSHSAHPAFTVKVSNVDWHRKMGHPSDQKLSTLIKKDYIKDSKISNCESVICETCVKSKQTRLPFKTNDIKTTYPLELIHTDIAGPIDPISYGEKRYVLTFLDDFTHFTVVYLLKNKSEVTQHFEEYVKQVCSKFNTKIHRLG